MSAYAQVLVPRPFKEAFDYAICHPERGVSRIEGSQVIMGDPSTTGQELDSWPFAQDDITVGAIVEAPFGAASIWGMVESLNPPKIAPEKIKPIKNVSDLPPLSPSFRDWLRWVADYTFSPPGLVLSLALPVKEALVPPTKRMGAGLPPSPLPKPSPHTLSPEQRAAADALSARVTAKAFSATLLDGVTGSGKTEVYSEAIRTALGEGKQVLVLLPEIVLTAQLIARFEKSLGFAPLEWHSNLTPKARRETYRAVAKGDAKLVVGARSALFLPYPNLGLIVVDEEHEASYKQEDGVIYHARDMAVARAHHEKIPVVLVSASPSLETLQNVQGGKFTALHLHERHGEARLPDIRVVDMRKEKLDAEHFLSAKLKDALAENLVKGEQSLLYLNRRGYAPLTLCRHCGYRFQSPDSSAWMVLHVPKKGAPYLQCHHSGYRIPLPEACPECGEKESFAACGPGVERVREEVAEFLPQARVALMTSDTVEDAASGKRLVEAIEAGEVDIIIGTQMVAKGHHFPNLTLVGVVDADLGLEGGDLRAAERTFQLLQQVSGRAGREGRRGRALLQSFLPETSVMQALVANDRRSFMQGEFSRRKEAGMPPFARLAGIIVSGRNEAEVRDMAKQLASMAPRGQGFRVLGPAPAPMLLLRGNYRHRLLVIAGRNIDLQKLLHSWLDGFPLPRSLKVKVDVDPYSFV